MLHCHHNYVYADGNWEELAGQLGNLVKHPNPSQPNPGFRADGTTCRLVDYLDLAVIYLIITLWATARTTAAVWVAPCWFALPREVKLLPLGAKGQDLALLRLEGLPAGIAPEPRFQVQHAPDYFWNKRGGKPMKWPSATMIRARSFFSLCEFRRCLLWFCKAGEVRKQLNNSERKPKVRKNIWPWQVTMIRGMSKMKHWF